MKVVPEEELQWAIKESEKSNLAPDSLSRTEVQWQLPLWQAFLCLQSSSFLLVQLHSLDWAHCEILRCWMNGGSNRTVQHKKKANQTLFRIRYYFREIICVLTVLNLLHVIIIKAVLSTTSLFKQPKRIHNKAALKPKTKIQRKLSLCSRHFYVEYYPSPSICNLEETWENVIVMKEWKYQVMFFLGNSK